LASGVYHSYADERYDLIFDLGDKLLRIQCKCAAFQGDVVLVRLYSNRRGPEGMITRKYTPEQIDGFAAYCAETNCCYFLPTSFTRLREARLRVGPTKNNQSAGVRWARDYEFAATMERLGAVAQLGERCDGIAEARGSSPLGSMRT
jgi:hypothetical protein